MTPTLSLICSPANIFNFGGTRATGFAREKCESGGRKPSMSLIFPPEIVSQFARTRDVLINIRQTCKGFSSMVAANKWDVCARTSTHDDVVYIMADCESVARIKNDMHKVVTRLAGELLLKGDDSPFVYFKNTMRVADSGVKPAYKSLISEESARAKYAIVKKTFDVPVMFSNSEIYNIIKDVLTPGEYCVHVVAEFCARPSEIIARMSTYAGRRNHLRYFCAEKIEFGRKNTQMRVSVAAYLTVSAIIGMVFLVRVDENLTLPGAMSNIAVSLGWPIALVYLIASAAFQAYFCVCAQKIRLLRPAAKIAERHFINIAHMILGAQIAKPGAAFFAVFTVFAANIDLVALFVLTMLGMYVVLVVTPDKCGQMRKFGETLRVVAVQYRSRVFHCLRIIIKIAFKFWR